MANPSNARSGQPHLSRDGQQWVFDYVVKQTGLTYHWWSDEKSELPAEVRSHAMISKHLGRRAMAREAEADHLAGDGDKDAALHAYGKATRDFLKAQHPIFEVNAEKEFLYSGLRRVYDKLRTVSPYRIERIEVPFDGSVVAGWLHLCPGVRRAPLLFSVPGCDTTAEGWPNAADNPAHRHRWHVFSFDGPGLGQSNLRGIALAGDNFERAAQAALDVLVQRPEIDENAVLLQGSGFGGYWALRLASIESRVLAVAAKSSFADTYYLMNEDSPRYKRLFAFLTQSRTEEELDTALSEMTLDGVIGRITCPTLMLTGEYDHRDPLDEVYRLFDQITTEAEMWVFADCFHKIHFANGKGTQAHVLNWLEDRLQRRPMSSSNRVLYIEPEATGPSGPGVSLKRWWYQVGESV